jgi:hypothetical protein
MTSKEEAKPKNAENKSEEEEPLFYFGDLTIAQKQKRYKKICCFYGFIDYEWGDETSGVKGDPKTGAQQWQIYKEVHNWINMTDHQRQLLKRKYYVDNVEKDFEDVMVYKTDEDKDQFMKFCQLYNALGELGFQAIKEKESKITTAKRMLYLGFMVFRPMNVPNSWFLLFLAILISI